MLLQDSLKSQADCAPLVTARSGSKVPVRSRTPSPTLPRPGDGATAGHGSEARSGLFSPLHGGRTSGAKRPGEGAISSPLCKGGVPEEPTAPEGRGVGGKPQTLEAQQNRPACSASSKHRHRPGPLGGRATSPWQEEEPDRTGRHCTIVGDLCSLPPRTSPAEPGEGVSRGPGSAMRREPGAGRVASHLRNRFTRNHQCPVVSPPSSPSLA